MEDSRLVIARINLLNFKSFYGPGMIVEFHTQFTSVIGPNGSGKSNLIDAMLFVFGCRASRIRQPKIVDLIHKSSKHRDLSKARVEVQFARADSANTLIPDSNFTIAREVHANGDNFYLMKGSRTTAHAVTSFLRDLGIDLDHNRFLILQGEVESIALMKPVSTAKNETSLLEYIEEIIGSNSFILKLFYLNKKLKKSMNAVKF
jgi:structural maintenance of chromosome 4